MVKTILIIDDNQDILKLFSEILNQPKYKIITAGDGDKALQLLKSNKVDLILLDLLMPNMPGLIFLKKIRESKKYDAIKVIIFSVFKANLKLKNHVFDKKDVSGYLEKPVKPYILKKEVKRCIG